MEKRKAVGKGGNRLIAGFMTNSDRDVVEGSNKELQCNSNPLIWCVKGNTILSIEMDVMMTTANKKHS